MGRNGYGESGPTKCLLYSRRQRIVRYESSIFLRSHLGISLSTTNRVLAPAQRTCRDVLLCLGLYEGVLWLIADRVLNRSPVSAVVAGGS